MVDACLIGWGRPPDVIKMAIEGGEVDALRGAVQTLRAGVRSLVVESLGANLHLCLSLLESEGYRVGPRVASTPLHIANEFVARRNDAAVKP
jgi:hypothetical protein